METLYKYRNFNNWKFILDIFINKKLFASPYDTLNDPMEGVYYYSPNIISENIVTAIRDEKQNLRICSLSKKFNDTLMWSHYSDSHRGIVFGVEIIDGNNTIKEIDYVDKLLFINNKIHSSIKETAINILTKKYKNWKYEAEVRAFTDKDYVKIDIKEIYLGCKANDKLTRDLIKSLIIKYTNIIGYKQLNDNELTRQF